MKAKFHATEIRSLPERDSGIEKQFVRLNTSRVTVKGNDRTKFRRREGVLLHNPDTGLSTVCFAMGGTVPVNAVAIDYDTRHALGLGYGQNECNIKVQRASYARVIHHFLTHQDLGYRLSIQLGLLGAVLGLLSIVPAVVDLIGSVGG